MDAEAFPVSTVWSPVTNNYEWPRNNLQDDIRYVTHGRFEDLPQSTAKVVRIFMSSTFTDYYAERNCLIKYVYPKLKTLCREKYDLDFQVVDMRWGIRNEASLDHSASELCMTEIHSCQRLSVGPTFVSLLSHRYGGCPLPSKVPVDEMKTITDTIKNSKNNFEDDLKMVEKWYKLDTNAIPNEFILQPIVDNHFIENQLMAPLIREKVDEPCLRTIYDKDEEDGFGMYPLKDDNEEQTKQRYTEMVTEGRVVWRKEEPVLTSAIRTAARKAMAEGRMTEEIGQKYIQSVTEEEIREGIVTEHNCKDRCLAFIRDITDFNKDHSKAWRFFEVENGQMNHETNDLLNKIKDDIIVKHIPPENIYRFTTKWSDNDGINETDHKEYLEDFCQKFETSLMDLIERGFAKTAASTEGDIYPEVLEHGQQCVQKVQGFYGREDVLHTIRTYLTSSSDQPLVVHGESGSGKTCVLAKAAAMAPVWLGDDGNLLIILRFLGTSPDSSSIHKTLTSVSKQLISLLEIESKYPKLPEEFLALKNFFLELLDAVPSDKRVVIFLDSLDRLSKSNKAHNYRWLPRRLPKYVKVVVSILEVAKYEKEFKLLSTLKSKQMDLRECQFVSVKNLTPKEGYGLISVWLKQKNRCLSNYQDKILRYHLRKTVKPLYLRMVFDELSQWRSYDKPAFDCPTIPSCLDRLFLKLETKHGKTIVTRALIYILISENGLTEIELEDILSLDDVVLSDVFEFHIPPIRRLPSILWARIRSDIQDYIVDRDAGGARVMAWYHRQFITEAKKRYLPTGNSIDYLPHSNKIALPMYKILAEYFAGTWADGKLKPFQYTKKQAAKLKLESVDAAENRYVPSQPVFIQSDTGTIDLQHIRYNLRKLAELPAAVTAIYDHENITQFIVEHIGLNQEFLTAWSKNTPWYEILEFIDSVSDQSRYIGSVNAIMRKIRRAQYKSETELEKFVKHLDWNKVKTGTNGLLIQMAMVKACLLFSYSDLVNNSTYLGSNISGRMLQYNCIMDGKWIRYTDNEGRKLCALVPPHMQLDTAGGELLMIINMHTSPVNAIEWISPEGDGIVSCSDKIVVMSLEAEVLVDVHPRNIPPGDSFRQVVSIGNGAEEDDNNLYFASLSQNPWVYIFDSQGDIVVILCLEQHLPPGKSAFKISNIQVIKDNDDEYSIFAADSSQSFIIKVENVLQSKRQSKVVSLGDSQAHIQIMIVLSVGTSYRLLLSDESTVFHLCEASDGKIIDQKPFDWPEVIAFDFVHNISEVDLKIILAFSTGQICLIRWDKMEDNLSGFTPMYLLTENQIKPMPKYGTPNSVHVCNTNAKEDISKKYAAGIVCTNKYLIALASGSQSSSSNSEGANKDIGETMNDCSSLVTVCKIKGKYDRAVFTANFMFILAARGGTLDVFKVTNLKSQADGPSRVSFFTTIEAHGDTITKILPMDEDVMFMTASLDSSIKFFVLIRTGILPKYLPNFHQTDSNITDIIPGDEYAITISRQSRYIYKWELVTGRITTMLRHPSNGTFVKCATDDEMNHVLAIDKKGNVHYWSLQEESCLKQNVKQSSPIEQDPNWVEADVRDPSDIIESVVNISDDIQSSDIHLLVFEGGVAIIASKKMDDIHLLELSESGKNGNGVVEDLKGPYQFVVKLKQNKAVLVKRNNAYIFNITTKKLECSHIFDCDSVEDLKYLPTKDELIITSQHNIIAWELISSKSSSNNIKQIDGGNLKFDKGAKVLTSSSHVLLLDLIQNQFTHLDTSTNTVLTRSPLSVPPPVQMYCYTADGKYLVLLSGDKDIYLYRVRDGKLLAWYTMYIRVTCLSASVNSWYVLIGTSNRRLFVLIIADPDERDHDIRIRNARDSNSSLSIDKAMALMSEGFQFDRSYNVINEDEDDESDDEGDDQDSSDDELWLARTEIRLKNLAEKSRSNKNSTIVEYSTEDDENDEADATNGDSTNGELLLAGTEKRLKSIAERSRKHGKNSITVDYSTNSSDDDDDDSDFYNKLDNCYIRNDRNAQNQQLYTATPCMLQ